MKSISILIVLFVLLGIGATPSWGQSQTREEPPSANQPSATEQDKDQQQGTNEPTPPETAQENREKGPQENASDRTEEEAEAKGYDPDTATIKIPDTWKRLGKNEIWVDFKNKQVIFAGAICLRNGQLEMFACPGDTKAHESVIAANALASEVHAALIAIGASPGKPCQWDPEYQPVSGPQIDVQVRWHDEASKKTVTRPAQSMVRNVRTKKPMEQKWVFGGSTLWEDPDSKRQIYTADGGEMICLSNFSNAMMDLNIQSSQSNDGLLFEANTKNIPPLGTKVYLILKPGDWVGPRPATQKPEPAPDQEKKETPSPDQPEKTSGQ